MVSPVHKNTNAPRILIVCDVIFWMLPKRIISEFTRFSGGPHPKIALRCAQDYLGVKKVLAPLKNLLKSPIMCFARIKK